MSELGVGKTVLGRYLIEQRLGMGSFGTVWLATDATDGAKIALKVLHTRYHEAPITRARFEREARVLLDLAHPSIASARALHQDGELVCFALELVEGQSLDLVMGERTRAGKPYSLDEVGLLFAQLCGAMEHAHSLGLVHRDLKPSNVMVDPGGKLKVLDFGLVKLLDTDKSDATTRGRRVGSIMYMSPEQARSEPIDARSDVFALGTILYELLTLERCWALGEDGGPVKAYDTPLRSTKGNSPTETFARIFGAPRPRPSLRRPELPPEIDEVIARATSVDPAPRYASAGPLLDAIREALGAEHVPTAVRALAEATQLSTQLRTARSVPAILTGVRTAPALAAELDAPDTRVTAPSFASGESAAGIEARIRTPAPRRSAMIGGAVALAAAGAFFALARAPAPVTVLAPERAVEPAAIGAASRSAAPAPSPTPSGSPAATAPPTPSATPRPARPVEARPKASAPPAPEAPKPTPSARPYAPLWALLASAKQSADPGAIRRLSDGILAAAKADVADAATRQKITRLAESSGLVGDVAGLELALGVLTEARK